MSHTGHDAHAHSHSHHDPAASQTKVLITFWLIAVFMVLEAFGGWWAGSLTLMADAGHMLTDSGALALAWFAARAMRRPSDALRSYGHDRFSVLAALINGLSLIAIAGWIALEAVQRLIAPEAVKAVPMIAIAATGLMVNSAAFFMLHGADRDDMNIHGALLHVLGDIMASVAAVAAAAIIIVKPAWTAADPIFSAVAGILILRNAVGLVRRSWHVLMEATPEGVDVAEIESALETLDGVRDIHHLHAWALVPGKTLITLHAQVETGRAPDAVLAEIKQTLAERFHIDHSTIQIESACADDEDHRDHPTRRDGHDPDHAHGHHAHEHGHSHAPKLAATR